jgi:lysophospholipase L1-like esterase
MAVKDCQRPLKDLVNEAEVMVLFGNPDGADHPTGVDTCVAGGYVNKYKLPDFDTYKNNLMANCTQDGWSTYKTNLGAVIEEIFKIREGRPIILRMTDFYIPVHARYIANEIDDVCTACLTTFSDSIRQVATDHGVPVAETMAGFNGNDNKSDPVELGYIREDGIHPSDAGAQFLAILLQQTGYAYAGK